MQAIGKALSLDITLQQTKEARNVSPRVISVADLNPELASRLREYYAEDVALYRKAEAGGFGDVTRIIRGKLGNVQNKDA